jgi:hypothetical protein
VIRSTLRGAVVLAASGALAVVLSGCGAGQVTQTENQQPPVDGVNAASDDGTILLRNAAFAYPGPDGYRVGGTAPLRLRLLNKGDRAVRLVAVDSEGGTVTLAAGGSGAPSAAGGSAAPSAAGGSAAPSAAAASPRATAPSTRTPSPGSTATPSPGSTATPSPGASAGPSAPAPLAVNLATGELVALDPTSPQYLQLGPLKRDLRSGDRIRLIFRFDSGAVIDVDAPVAVPTSPLPRTPLELDTGH